MRWTVTANKMIDGDNLKVLNTYLENQKDLGAIRDKPEEIRDAYIMWALFETGLRGAELCSLQVRDYTGKTVEVRHGKGGKPRSVLLSIRGRSLFREWIQHRLVLGMRDHEEAALFETRLGERFTTRGLRMRVKRAFKGAGLSEKYSTHTARHTNCSVLLNNGESIARVRDNLGHHSLAVTNLYAHATAELKSLEVMPSSQKAEYTEVRPARKGLTRHSLADLIPSKRK